MQQALNHIQRSNHGSRTVTDVAVIGAGVVGLAIARGLAKRGVDVTLLEAASQYGSQTSSRNSGIIHSGLYYEPGLLRANLCVSGKQQLYTYCADKSIAHSRLGKLLVATEEDQVSQLQKYRSRGAANGVNDLEWLDGKAAMELEPKLKCHAAILSPSTGIIDVHGLMQGLLADAKINGAKYHSTTKVVAGNIETDAKQIHVWNTGAGEESTITARYVVNAAGLQAQDTAIRLGVPRDHVPELYMAKGSYFSLKGSQQNHSGLSDAGKAPFKHLIYPMPNEAGLGTHLTLNLSGGAMFGPDVEYIQRLNYTVDPHRGHTFYAAIRQYWPDLPDNSLQADFSGVRPKLHAPGTAQGDFVIDSDTAPGVLSLYGIESPGLTSSLAIAELVADKLLEQ